MTEQCAQEEEEAARSIKASFSRAKEPSSAGADDPDRAAVSSFSLSLPPLSIIIIMRKEGRRRRKKKRSIQCVVLEHTHQ